jgi:hypothetical protein
LRFDTGDVTENEEIQGPGSQTEPGVPAGRWPESQRYNGWACGEKSFSTERGAEAGKNGMADCEELVARLRVPRNNYGEDGAIRILGTQQRRAVL